MRPTERSKLVRKWKREEWVYVAFILMLFYFCLYFIIPEREPIAKLIIISLVALITIAILSVFYEKIKTNFFDSLDAIFGSPSRNHSSFCDLLIIIIHLLGEPLLDLIFLKSPNLTHLVGWNSTLFTHSINAHFAHSQVFSYLPDRHNYWSLFHLPGLLPTYPLL